MKTSRSLLNWFWAVSLAVAQPLLAEPPTLPVVGQDAPSFTGLDQDGVKWKLTDHLGKKVLFLYFYPKDDTTGCTAEACGLRDRMLDIKEAGVDVAGVSFDDLDAHKNFIFKYNLSFPLLADTDGVIADAYGVRMGELKKMDSPKFAADEIKDLPGIINRLREQSDPVTDYLWKGLSTAEQTALVGYEASASGVRQAQEIVVHAFEKALNGPSLYKAKRFKGISLRPETASLIKKKPKGGQLIRFNRLLLEDTFPAELTRNRNMARRVSFLIGLDGKIIHITDSPDPAVHLKELAAAMRNLRGNGSP